MDASARYWLKLRAIKTIRYNILVAVVRTCLLVLVLLLSAVRILFCPAAQIVLKN